MISDDWPSALGKPEDPGNPDPYRSLGWIQANMPVCEMPSMVPGRKSWLVTSYGHGKACLTDPRLSLDVKAAPDRRGYPGNFLGAEGWEHARLRRLVQGAFSASAVKRFAPKIQAICDAAVSGLADQDAFDLVARYAVAIPVAVIHTFLGIPRSEREPAERFMNAYFQAGISDPNPSSEPPRQELHGYIDHLIAYKRLHSADDVITQLISSMSDGDVASEDELRGLVYFLLGAGHLSTVPALSTAMLATLMLGDEVRAHGWSRVVSESLRYYSPVQMSHKRVAVEDVDLATVRIGQGDIVDVSFAAANRDPGQFAHPDEFRPARPRRQNLAFSTGRHHCPGARLASTEIQIALRTLFHSLGVLRLVREPRDLAWSLGPVLRGLRELPVTHTPRQDRLSSPVSLPATGLARPGLGPSPGRLGTNPCAGHDAPDGMQ